MKKTAVILAVSLISVGLILVFCALIPLHFDLSSVDKMRYETNTYPIIEEFSDIQIETDTADICFLPATDGENKVVCAESEKVRHDVAVRGGVLTVTVTDSRAWYERWGIFTAQKMRVTVYLADSVLGDLTIKTDTGDTSIPADFSFADVQIESDTGDVSICAKETQSLSVKTDTGDILAENIATGSIYLDIHTGDVTLRNVRCGAVEAQATTGDVTLDGVQAQGGLSLTTDTGDVTLADTLFDESVAIKTNTGDVTLERADAASFSVQTSTGDVRGTVLTEKIFLAETSTGKVQVPNTAAGGIFQWEK